jgi:hypothetical protein
MQILSDKGRLDSFLSVSFSIKIFDQISKLPESQNYVKQTMSRIYETMDLDYLETVNLEEVGYHCKTYIDRRVQMVENASKETEDISIIIGQTDSHEDTSIDNSDFYDSVDSPLTRESLLDKIKEPKMENHRSVPL